MSNSEQAGLQQALERLSQKNERYFVIGIVMAAILFVALIVIAFLQLHRPVAAQVISPLLGSSAAVVVWRMFKTWREKTYTDCILALVANVDADTRRTIIEVLVKKL